MYNNKVEFGADASKKQPLLMPLSDDQDKSVATSPVAVSWLHGRKRWASPSWRLLCCLVVASTVLSSWLTSRHIGRHSLSLDHGPCGDLNTEPPSILATIDRSWHMEQFYGFNYSTSPWTEDPKIVGEQVDRMWHNNLGLDGTYFMIRKSEAAAFSLDEKIHAMIPESESGLGEDAFIVWFEHLHLLHCLNDIRKHLYYNYDYYGDGELQEMEVIHSNHCLDALRESIMCSADIGIVPQIWTWDGPKNRPAHVPDFNMPHRCHDYGATRDWMYSHQLPERLQAKDAAMLPGQVVTVIDKRPRVT